MAFGLDLSHAWDQDGGTAVRFGPGRNQVRGAIAGSGRGGQQPGMTLFQDGSTQASLSGQRSLDPHRQRPPSTCANTPMAAGPSSSDRGASLTARPTANSSPGRRQSRPLPKSARRPARLLWTAAEACQSIDPTGQKRSQKQAFLCATRTALHAGQRQTCVSGEQYGLRRPRAGLDVRARSSLSVTLDRVRPFACRYPQRDRGLPGFEG